jgi:hypothetical protein
MSINKPRFDHLGLEKVFNIEMKIIPTFKYKPKKNEEGKSTYNLNGLDEHWYRTVANNFSFMLPTDLTYLHGEWMAVYNGLLTAYNKNKQVDNNRDNYNKLVEYFNILIMIEYFLEQNEKQIEHGVNAKYFKHDFEFKIKKLLMYLDSYKEHAKTQIAKINADILKKYNEKSLLISSYNYELENYNYNLKKTLYYESIYNEVLTRLKISKDEYMEVLHEDNPASGEPHNEAKKKGSTNHNMSGGSLRRNSRRRSHRNRNRHCRSRSRIRNSRKNIRKTKKH